MPSSENLFTENIAHGHPYSRNIVQKMDDSKHYKSFEDIIPLFLSFGIVFIRNHGHGSQFLVLEDYKEYPSYV